MYPQSLRTFKNNTYKGKLTCKNVADSFEGYDYVDIKELMQDLYNYICLINGGYENE